MPDEPINTADNFLMDLSRSSSRDLPLDLVKGLMVIVMVIYHTMNYFSTAGAEEFGYVRFVTGAFIFISGYVIAVFYEKKLQTDWAGASARLITRGVKLLMIFTVLNIIISVTGIGNPYKEHIGIYRFFNTIPDIYIFGRPGTASFQILLPISYLLILSPITLIPTGYWKYTLIISSALLAGWLDLHYENIILDCGTPGLIGILAGTCINNCKKQYRIHSGIVCVCCLLAILFSMSYLSRNYLTYIISIIILIKILYDMANIIDIKNRISSSIISFGQYSLLCYIMQIIFLQGLSRVLGHQRWGFGYELISLFCITNIFLLTFCTLLSFYRNQYNVLDKTYRFIF